MHLQPRTYWHANKECTPLRQMRSLLRYLEKPLITTQRYKHKMAVEWYYRINITTLWLKVKKNNFFKTHRKVIVISQVVHLGDIVACEPIVRQVRTENPDAFILFALHRNYRELADAFPEVDYVLPLICISEWARFAGLALFDKIYDLNIYGRSCEICKVPWLKSDGDRGITTSNYYNFGNLLDIYCKTGGVTSSSVGPKLSPGEENIEVVSKLNLPDKFVVLHAGSNEQDRELPVSALCSIIKHINTTWGLPVIEIGLKHLAIAAEDKVNRSLCSNLSILQSAEVIRRSVLYLGTDSGPAHMANAVGTYGIIVLGHYRHFCNYMPYSGDYANSIRSELLYHDGPVAEMPVARVIDAIDRRLTVLGETELRSS